MFTAKRQASIKKRGGEVRVSKQTPLFQLQNFPSLKRPLPGQHQSAKSCGQRKKLSSIDESCCCQRNPARMKFDPSTLKKPDANVQHSPQTNPPPNWPSEITYLTDQTYSQAVDLELRSKLSRSPSDNISWIKLASNLIITPCPLVDITTITDEKHPAYGQRGLFAAQHLIPDSFICLYLGHVHTNSMSDTDPHSDYDLSMSFSLYTCTSRRKLTPTNAWIVRSV